MKYVFKPWAILLGITVGFITHSWLNKALLWPTYAVVIEALLIFFKYQKAKSNLRKVSNGDGDKSDLIDAQLAFEQASMAADPGFFVVDFILIFINVLAAASIVGLFSK